MVLTPRRWRQVGSQDAADDGDKKARSPRRARRKPLKPLRAGMPGDFRCDRCEYSCAFCTTTSHTRLRVHWAPGIPHALFGAEDLSRPRAHRVARATRMSGGHHCDCRNVIATKPMDRSYATLPSTISKNTRLTSPCVSLTRACSEEKSGASPARAITRSRSSPAFSGLNRSLTQSRRICVRS